MLQLAIAVANSGCWARCGQQHPWRPDAGLRRRNLEMGSAPVLDLMMDAADGDIAAALEMGAIVMLGAGAARLALTLVATDAEAAPPPASSSAGDTMVLEIDLGDEGEPKGVSRLFFRPLLPRSDLLQITLRMPLGLLISEAQGSILVDGTLPGTSRAILLYHSSEMHSASGLRRVQLTRLAARGRSRSSVDRIRRGRGCCTNVAAGSY